jgi:hypothetical protein
VASGAYIYHAFIRLKNLKLHSNIPSTQAMEEKENLDPFGSRSLEGLLKYPTGNGPSLE